MKIDFLLYLVRNKRYYSDGYSSKRKYSRTSDKNTYKASIETGHVSKETQLMLRKECERKQKLH